jgi:hypothetical protein
MKKFSEFIVEARSSQAAQKAHKIGLKGDGHGYWIDKQQKRVARTIKGQLQFIDGKKKGKKGEENDGGEVKEPSRVSPEKFKGQKPGRKRLGAKTEPTGAKKAPVPAAPKPKSKAVVQEPLGKQKETVKGDVVTVVFGKFNPPTQAHKKVFDSAKQTASGGNFYIFPSRTQDGKKNPLDPDTKISYMKEMFPEYADNIIDSDEFKTIFDVFQFLNQEGYAGINIVCGAERVSEIDNLANKNNGKLYDYQSINVVSSGSKDAESENGSSDVARKAAAEEDFETFKKAFPQGFKNIKQLFTDLQQSMNIKEGYRLWEIAPEYDWRGLRENYVFGHLYQVGTMIESCNTGLVGQVIRSGANHLICVTEDGTMFKSWIKDVCEYTEVKMDKMTREPGKPNTLVGTVGYTKYVASMTPGATLNTINKKRKVLIKSK